MDLFGILALIVCFFMYKKINHLEKIIGEANLVSKKQKNQVGEINQGYSSQDKFDNINEKLNTGEIDQTESTAYSEEKKEEDGLLVLFFRWMAVDWLMKLGSFLLVLAFAWFVSYAFINNWVGPMGRITFGIVAGVIVLLLGEWRIKKSVDQGGVFLVLGGTIILLTIFAAREIYEFFTPAVALFVMFSVVVFVALSSVRYKSRKLAVLSLVMGAIAPLFTNTPDPSMFGLMSYLFTLSLGTLWVVAVSGWRILTPLSLFIVFVYNIPFLFSYLLQDDKSTGILFAYLFGFLFYLFSLIIIIYNKRVEKPDLVVALFNGLFLLLWINHVIPDEYKSIISMAVALIVAIGAFVVFKTTKLKEPVYINSAVAIAFLVAATAFELNGPALVIAFTIEAGLLAMIPLYLAKNVRTGQKLSLVLLAPAVMSLESFSPSVWRQSILHDDFFVLLTFALVTLALGIQFYIYGKKDNLNVIPEITNSIFIVSATYFMFLIWLSLEAGIVNNDTAHMIALIIYTLAGLVFYIRGVLRDKLYFRWVGGSLLGVVVLRLLFVEAWKMDLSGRIITFFVVAILLIATAFISKKNEK